MEQNRASTLFLHLVELAGRTLRDYETVVKLVAKTTTAKGLTVTCRLPRRLYATGRKVTAEEMKQVNLQRDRFPGEWNYVVRPRELLPALTSQHSS
jgi:hypothetical protein